MKGNLGHSMKPRVLCFKHFKHLLPQAKASAVVKNIRGMLKKIIVKKKKRERWILCSLLALRERINIGHLRLCTLLHLLFSEN